MQGRSAVCQHNACAAVGRARALAIPGGAIIRHCQFLGLLMMSGFHSLSKKKNANR